MTAEPALAPLLSHLRAEPSRTWSLIITLYGDAIVPRGGRVWLGTVLDIFAALEIGGNVVRTAMSRLAADGWLARNRVGRNSYYGLAEKGRDEFAAAAARIYAAAPPGWDGAFHMAVGADAGRAALERAGYAPLGPGVLVGIAPPPAAARAILLRATADPDSARQFAAQVWPTERLEAGYRRLIAAFSPLAASLRRGSALPGLPALAARLLLVHEYRRLVLRDPQLPAALLPPDHAGTAARALCATLYPALLPASEAWLDAHALTEAGPLPPPEVDLFRRFQPPDMLRKSLTDG